jgi:hypothetical protein
MLRNHFPSRFARVGQAAEVRAVKTKHAFIICLAALPIGIVVQKCWNEVDAWRACCRSWRREG